MKKELVDLVMKKWDIPNLCIKEIYGNDSEDFPRIIGSMQKFVGFWISDIGSA